MSDVDQQTLLEISGPLIKRASESFQAVIAHRGPDGVMSWDEMAMALKISDAAARVEIACALIEIAKHAGAIPKAISAVEQQLKARNRR